MRARVRRFCPWIVFGVVVALTFGVSPTQAQELTIADASITESAAGNVTTTFVVSLSAPAGVGGVTFDIATANDTAIGGFDYIVNSQTAAVIAQGSSTADFTVIVNDDVVFEGLQRYFVNISNVVGATVVDAQAIGTILDNEPIPTPAFATASTGIAEGAAGSNAMVLVTVNLSGISEVPLSFEFATADATAIAGFDYVSSSGTLAFAPGESQKTIAVSLIGDNADEADESLTLDLLIPRGGDTHLLNILNDDTAGVVANAIPALSEWGCILLLMLIGCASAGKLLGRHATGCPHHRLHAATLAASSTMHMEPPTRP